MAFGQLCHGAPITPTKGFAGRPTPMWVIVTTATQATERLVPIQVQILLGGRPANGLQVCQMTIIGCSFKSLAGRSGRARTCDPRFWRPVLYQLSYTPTSASPPNGPFEAQAVPCWQVGYAVRLWSYSTGSTGTASGPVPDLQCDRGASAHSRLAPLPGAFSNTQRLGGTPHTRSSSRKPTQCPSGAR